jgi:nitrite reductase (NADH) large subunit
MKVVIVGAGPAGVTTAETLRMHDKDTEIVMLTNEPYPPYSPPAMVDHFLTGSELHFWRGEDWAEEQQIDYRSGVEVHSLDLDASTLELTKGKPIAFEKLVIATGSRLYAPLQGAELPGVYNFKSLSAAEKLIKEVKQGKASTAVIVGAGFIGMEIALLLRALDVEVTQVEMLDQVMPAMLDPQTAAYALDVMRERGVEVRLNTKATEFEGNKKVASVKLENGESLEADIYIAATGVKPNVGFLNGTDLETEWGVAVDDHLNATHPDVFAAGDVAETPDRLTGERYVSAIFPNAIAQGEIVGLNIAGYDREYEGSDRMNSLKHLDLPVVAVGLKEGDELLESSSDGHQRRIYLEDGRIVGFQLVGDVSPAGVLRTLMIRREDIRRLKDHLLTGGFGEGTVVWSALTNVAA